MEESLEHLIFAPSYDSSKLEKPLRIFAGCLVKKSRLIQGKKKVARQPSRCTYYLIALNILPKCISHAWINLYHISESTKSTRLKGGF